MRKEAIGITIDGTDVRIAHLAASSKGLILKRIEIATLPERIGLEKGQGADEEQLRSFEEAFGQAAQEEQSEQEQQEEAQDAASALLSLLSGYNLRRAKLALNVPEDGVSYYTLNDNFAVKGTKLKKALIEMVAPTHDAAISPEMVGYIKGADKTLACVVCDSEPLLLPMLKELRPFLGRNKPYVGLIDSIDLALVGLARANHDLAEGEITAIVYISLEYSRVVVMKGKEFLRVLPSINEGAQSSTVSKTVFSKILFEQDEGDLPQIDRLILAGQAETVGAIEFFKENMPEAKVELMKMGKFARIEVQPSSLPAPISTFSLPIALARKALEPKNPSYYETNFIPGYLKEAQKPFRIAWHGFVTLGVIFALSLVLVLKANENYKQIQAKRELIRWMRQMVIAGNPIVVEVDLLKQQIDAYKKELARLAQVARNSKVWSRSLQKVCDLADRCESVWLTGFSSSTNEGYQITGKSTSREKVALLASAYTNSYLDVVSRGMVRDYRVWDFALRVRFPDVLDQPAYLALLQRRNQQKPGMPGLSVPPGFAGPPAGLASRSRRSPSAKMPGSMGHQAGLFVNQMLRAGFDAYYEMSERVARKQRNEAAAQQKLAVAEKPLEVKYRGPKAASSGDSEPVSERSVAPAESDKPRGDNSADEQKGTKREDLEKPKPSGSDQTKSSSAPEPKAKTADRKRLGANRRQPKLEAGLKRQLDRAVSLFRQGNYESSFRILNTILSENPNPSLACKTHYWLGHCLFGMGRLNEAVEQFERAAECPGSGVDDAARFMLGNCYVRLGKRAEANSEYEKLIQGYPNSRFVNIASARLAQ